MNNIDGYSDRQILRVIGSRKDARTPYAEMAIKLWCKPGQQFMFVEKCVSLPGLKGQKGLLMSVKCDCVALLALF